jgi:hypothetical protein
MILKAGGANDVILAIRYTKDATISVISFVDHQSAVTHSLHNNVVGFSG